MPVARQPPSDPRDDALMRAARAALLPVAPQKIVVAVSGGGDSMAALHVFSRLAQTDDVQITTVTIDHGLRPEAPAEAAFVAQTCAALGVPHHVLRWRGWDGSGNLMAAARDARYRLIADWATQREIDTVILGHTQDDVAENFLIRLARKSGPDGLSAMDPRFVRDGMVWARPFCRQSREDLRAYLRRHNVAWIDDPTNEDEAFERVRARKAMATLAGLGISAATLDSVSLSMRAARDALNHYARIESCRYIVQDHGDLVLRLGLTGPLPAEIKRRLWRAAVQWVAGTVYPPRSAALFEVIDGLTADGTATVGGCLIVRTGDDWRVSREYQAVRETRSHTATLWDGRWALQGPHADEFEVRALGEGLRDCPEWRDTGLPRTSLMATPAIWHGDTLIAAPVAGLANGWSAQIVADFHEHAFAH